MRVEGGRLCLEVDPERGVVTSLTERGAGPRAVNYAANPDNLSHPGLRSDGPWLGDLLLRTWSGSGWQEEATGRSGDVREVRVDAEAAAVTIAYTGASGAGGLRSVDLTERFSAAGAGLRWDLEVTNRRSATVEVGELAIAFTTNTDYRGIFAARGPRERAAGPLQRQWHEQRVKQHLHVSGHSSYALLQRPRGDFPSLLFQPLDDTALEAAYQIDPSVGDQWSNVFEGPYYLAVHSRAARMGRRWGHHRERQRAWFHGHSSLLLRPGESRRLAFRFSLVDSYGAVAQERYDHGKVTVHAVPGMVVPRGEPVLLQLTSRHRPTLVREAGGIALHDDGAQDDHHRYRLRFDSPGHKQLLVRYDGDKWTRLLFYAIPPIAATLKARARFIVERQFYDNPQDPYGRHHSFLPYDDKLEALYLHSEEAWQVGASDEYGLPIAMYLAEKNALHPDRDEVGVLEAYIDDFLLGGLQDPQTLAVRRGRYWTEQTPSSRPHEWSEEEARRATRAFNYPLVANLYHSMYRVGRRYGLTRRRGPEQYLALAWRTAVVGLDLGELNATGAPMGAHAVELLGDLAREDPEGHRRLDERMRRFADRNRRDPYPFGSELYVDQTAHHHVYAVLRHYGFQAQALDALAVTKALRAGAQPTWFQYGNEQRGSVCCWYATSDNSAVLYDGFRLTGDLELLRWGFAGLTSFLVPVRDTGVAHGWFTWWPDRLGFDLRSLDTDMGLYGYLKAATSFVVDDPAFGLVGYGCRVAATGPGTLSAVPWDGVAKRMVIAPHGLGVSVDKGELGGVRLAAGRELELELTDAGGLAGAATVTVTGLEAGEYRVTAGGAERLLAAEQGALAIEGVRPASGAPVTVALRPAGA